MSDKKITYLLGAGASYQACPILNELGEKMIEMAKEHLKDNYNDNYEIFNDSSRNHSVNILQEIGYFGRKALEYGTIDTYAKKLSLNDDLFRELQSLKIVLSIFFVLWETSNDPIRKRENEEGKLIQFKSIDTRYISLLASLLEKEKEDDWPKLHDNVKFISWNYDMQIQKAFKAFISEKRKMKYCDINKHFPYRYDINETNPNPNLNLLHLNGYCGFYFNNEESKKYEEYSLLDRTDSTDIKEIIKELEFAYEAVKRKQVRINDHINYAWEQNKLAKQTRECAKRFFKESDVIVIIGYSFPPFNRNVDKLLFDELKGRSTKIYYQDPNASEDLIKTFIEPNNCEVITIKDNVKQFLVPFEY